MRISPVSLRPTVDMDVLSRPAEEFGNDVTVERLWAAEAIDHGNVYFNILRAVDPRLLRLTPDDDLIYLHFRQDFPNLRIDQVVEDELKSAVGKAKWRPFCEKFKNLVEKYSFGTLMRADVDRGYTDSNAILVPRIQFYAIEIARNREGANDNVRDIFRPTEEELQPEPTETAEA